MVQALPSVYLVRHGMHFLSSLDTPPANQEFRGPQGIGCLSSQTVASGTQGGTKIIKKLSVVRELEYVLGGPAVFRWEESTFVKQ